MLDLLEGKVAAEARRLAAFACLVVPAPEVPAALGWLATRAWHEAEGRDDRGAAAEPDSGPRSGSAGYATALHEDMSYERARVARGRPLPLRPDRGLHAAAAGGARPTATSTSAARQGLVSELLEGKVPATTLALVRYVVTGGRARDFVGTLDFLVEQTAAARGWRIAHVRAAAPIDEAQQTMLADSLARLAGQPVELQVVIDEALLSGALHPDRRPAGRRDGTRPARRAARAPRPGGVAADRVRPRRPGHTTTEDTEGAQ